MLFPHLSDGLSNNVLLLFASFQLVRRIYKGIPLQLRGEVWCLLLDVPKIKEEKKDFYEVRSQEFTAKHTAVASALQCCSLTPAAGLQHAS